LFQNVGNNLLDHMTPHTKRILPQKVYYENLFNRSLIKNNLSYSICRTLVHSNYPSLTELEIHLVPSLMDPVSSEAEVWMRGHS
jgi:hypothetical protein